MIVLKRQSATTPNFGPMAPVSRTMRSPAQLLITRAEVDLPAHASGRNMPAHLFEACYRCTIEVRGITMLPGCVRQFCPEVLLMSRMLIAPFTKPLTKRSACLDACAGSRMTGVDLS